MVQIHSNKPTHSTTSLPDLPQSHDEPTESRTGPLVGRTGASWCCNRRMVGPSAWAVAGHPTDSVCCLAPMERIVRQRIVRQTADLCLFEEPHTTGAWKEQNRSHGNTSQCRFLRASVLGWVPNTTLLHSLDKSSPCFRCFCPSVTHTMAARPGQWFGLVLGVCCWCFWLFLGLPWLTMGGTTQKSWR